MRYWIGAILTVVSMAANADELKTIHGLAYEDVTVTQVEDDGIRISHRDGVAKIPFEELSQSLRMQYGYDPIKATEARREVAEEETKRAEIIRQEQERARAEALNAKTEAEEERAHPAQQAIALEKSESRRRLEGAITAALLAAFIVITLVILYFLPFIVGFKKQNAPAIFVANLFLGWTFIGWVCVLVWAFTKDPSSPARR